MILVDANLLVYARVASLPPHEAARAWLDERLSGTAAVGLPWPSLLAFLRLVTNPRIFSKPETTASAWEQVEAWLASSAVWIPLPTDRHQEVLRSLLQAASTRANLIPDAHLAALALEHGLTLCSTDGDFARFPGVRWENPLTP
jgi:toxin-antitoxin system PIN domain toxin